MRNLRVLIAGAGVAAVETLLALRHLAGDRVDVDLLAPVADFVYRPATVLEPFGGGEPPRIPVGTITREHDCGHVFDSIVAVEPEGRRVHTAAGDSFDYQALVVATGAQPVEAVPGSLTFPGNGAVREFRGLLRALVEGRANSLVFAVPAEATWTLPLYELALLTARFLKARSDRRPALAVVTPERAPLDGFGERASETLRGLSEQHGVALHCGIAPEVAEADQLRLANGAVLAADRVVALPRVVGPEIPGLPSERGFLPVDRHGRVTGVDGVYAAGDVTTWSPKQGGLAAQQAVVVAESLAERAGASVRPTEYRPTLRGVVLTGEESAFLRSDRSGHHTRSMASFRPLWWPPAKVAGRYLGPYLAARGISVGR